MVIVELNWIMECLLLDMELLMAKIIIKLKIHGGQDGEVKGISILLEMGMEKVNVEYLWNHPYLCYDTVICI